MDPKLSNEQKLISKFIWAALLVANCVFCYLVWSELYAPYSLGGPSQKWFYTAGAAPIVALISFSLFKAAVNKENINNKFRTMGLEVPRSMQRNPTQFKEFDTLDDSGKKKIILRAELFNKLIRSWSLAETVNILGMISIRLDMPTQYYYYFFGATVLMMLNMFPKYDDLIDQLK